MSYMCWADGDHFDRFSHSSEHGRAINHSLCLCMQLRERDVWTCPLTHLPSLILLIHHCFIERYGTPISHRLESEFHRQGRSTDEKSRVTSKPNAEMDGQMDGWIGEWISGWRNELRKVLSERGR